MRYCIGDIHGCIKTLDYLINQIYKQDTNPTFYFVGDLIDRGPNSKSVIDLIIELTRKNLAQAILGNHEVMMLNAYKNNQSITQSVWQQNGAENTILSFNPEANLKFPIKDLIAQPYYKFINTLPYYIQLSDYLIVHAGFNFNATNPFLETEHMVWTREEQNDHNFTNGKTIIHGHSPVPIEQIEARVGNKKADIINIDSGCVYVQHKELGVLLAINLDERTLITAKNVDFE